MNPDFLTGRWHGLPIPRTPRRIAVVMALLAYPPVLLAWLGLQSVGVHVVVWASAVMAALGVLLVVDRGLWSWQNSLAQQPDAMLDERQIAVRDRAYLVGYRLFVTGTMLVLLVLGIGADILDPIITLTFDTVQPFFWAGVHYGMVLPSAAVAWSLPEAPSEDVLDHAHMPGTERPAPTA